MVATHSATGYGTGDDITAPAPPEMDPWVRSPVDLSVGCFKSGGPCPQWWVHLSQVRTNTQTIMASGWLVLACAASGATQASPQAGRFNQAGSTVRWWPGSARLTFEERLGSITLSFSVRLSGVNLNGRVKPTLNYARMDGIWGCRSKQSKTGGQHADWSQWNQVGSSERRQQERPRLELRRRVGGGWGA